MPKLPGWSRLKSMEKGKTIRYYKHDTFKNKTVEVLKNLKGGTSIAIVGDGSKTVQSPRFSRQKDAVQWAVDWMRKHSEGTKNVGGLLGGGGGLLSGI